METRTQIQIARNLQYLDDSEASALLSRADEVGRLLNGLLASLRACSRMRTSRRR